MSERKVRGLQNREGIWHMDKIVRGIRIYGSTGTGRLEEAEIVLARRIEDARKQAVFGARPRRKFREAATRYLNEYAHQKGIERNARALADLDPFIGDEYIDLICTETFAPYIEARPHLAWSTIARHLAVPRLILHLCARAWRDKKTRLTWLETAPLIDLENPPPAKIKVNKRPPYPLTWDEQRLFFSELAPHLERMAMYGANSGCRDQEICQLQWAWEHRVEGIGSVFVIPPELVKNNEPRVVVLNDVAQSIVDAERGKHPTHVFSYTPPLPSRDTFYLRRRARLQGVPVDELRQASEARPIDRLLSNGWRGARRRAAKRYERELGRPCPEGFRRLRVHDLKHTFGRRLRAAGVSLEDRQDLLGHKNGKITTHYSGAEIANLKALANLANEKRASSVLLRVVA